MKRRNIFRAVLIARDSARRSDWNRLKCSAGQVHRESAGWARVLRVQGI